MVWVEYSNLTICRDLILQYVLRNVFLVSSHPCFNELRVFDLSSDEIPCKPSVCLVQVRNVAEPADGGTDGRAWPLSSRTCLPDRVNKTCVSTVGSLSHSWLFQTQPFAHEPEE